MSLRTRLIKALVSNKHGNSLADSVAAKQAIQPFGAQSAPRTDTLANLGTDTSTRLVAIEAKINAILAADALII